MAKVKCTGATRLSKTPAKRKRGVCVKKSKVRPAMTSYMQAAKKVGFLVKGAKFKKLPKKGTTGHKEILALMK